MQEKAQEKMQEEAQKQKELEEKMKELTKALEKEKKDTNKLYRLQVLEKYNALTVKTDGLEKIKEYFSDYQPKTKTEKEYISYITSTKYYGKDTTETQKIILEILKS